MNIQSQPTTNVKSWLRRPSWDDYEPSYNSKFSTLYMLSQYKLRRESVKNARKIQLFENYFNRKTGGSKEFQFHNALDLMLWERGYSLVSTHGLTYNRKWQKGSDFFHVSSFGFGGDCSCVYKIPFQNIESVFDITVSWWNKYEK